MAAMASKTSNDTTNEKNENQTFISKLPNKRLFKDIINISKNPLNDEGIFYKHDSDDIKRGYAMIIGPTETPYKHGFYFFNFTFPETYPFDPPKLEFMTGDGKTRFNPNLYRQGKVCLSILNTWSGEQWTSCQTIRSVLLTLITVLNDKPLLNEPGIKESHSDFHRYNEMISYKNYEIAILKSVTNNNSFVFFKELFAEEISEYFNKHKDEIYKLMKLESDEFYKKHKIKENAKNKTLKLSSRVYAMTIEINYPKLLKSFEKLL